MSEPVARRWHVLLSETERQRMLSEIAVTALAIGRDLYPEQDIHDLDIRPGENGAAHDYPPCPRERLAFLAATWPRLTGALHRLENAPPSSLTQQTRLVPTERAGRVAPRAVLDALRSGDFVNAAGLRASPLAERLGGRLPRRVAETIVVPTHDSPANRAIKAILVHFTRDLRAIAELAQVVGAANVAADAWALRVRVQRHLRRAPWGNLPMPLSRVPSSLSSALRTNGAHGLIHDTYRRYRKAFRFDWTNPLFSLPARETWLLYEYWGLFQVADALRGLGFRAVSAGDFALSRGGLSFGVVRGTPSRLRFANPRGETVSLSYNRNFAGSREEAVANGWRSRSHAMRPDITLEGSGGRLLLFDTKFKTYTAGETDGIDTDDAAAPPRNLPLVDDLNQLHAYRDGIRRGEAAETPVQGAWLLYAGRVSGGNLPVLAYPRATPEMPYGSGKIGALLLRPGAVGNDHLRTVIAEFIAGAANGRGR